MRHVILNYSEEGEYPLAVFIKETALKYKSLTHYLIKPLAQAGVTESSIGVGLPYGDTKQVKMANCKDFLSEALVELAQVGVKYILCCDSGNYFKALTGAKKAEPHHGYVLPCTLKGFEDMGFWVVLCPNYNSLEYNPENQDKIDLAVSALSSHMLGTYSPLGEGIIHSEYYPETAQEFAEALELLHQYPMLTADIETFGLKHYEAGIASIAFSWDQHNGFASCIDYTINPEGESVRGFCGEKRQILKQFLIQYKGTLIWHGASFDLKVLIYELWMEDLLDQPGLLTGLDILLQKVQCTKIISYLATNSCVGNRLGLKNQAHEFAGNWAQDDIKNVLLISKEKLLRYNLVDCLSTWFTYSKNYPKLVKDNQSYVYETVFLPSLKTLVQTELAGNPLDMNQVKYTQEFLLEHQAKALEVLDSLDFITEYFGDSKFNPNSAKQIQSLVYGHLEYDVIDLTKAKQPSTAADTLKALRLISKCDEHTQMFDALLANSEVSILLNNFIKNFLLAPKAKDGWHYIFGNFNLGGTKSGRLSSSQINLQNLPSGGNKYAKEIKKCFRAPKDWLLVGSDYNGLEDVINTLLTKDPNKLKVLLDGYDGHSFRSFYFFPERLPGIVDTVESINSIKRLFPEVRQDAKAPAFALTYLGTWRTLVKNCGFSKPVAQQIENNFHELYKVSVDWVNAKIDQAKVDGYVTLAYGLRLRTPILQSRPDSSAAGVESRTAGNAVSGQSYGMVNSKAANEFMQEVWASEYRYDIKPIMQIHDAQYYLVRNDRTLVTWLNDRIPFHMVNQTHDLPELAHEQLGLGAELDVHYKGWHQPITLPNGASAGDIQTICNAAVSKYNSKE